MIQIDQLCMQLGNFSLNNISFAVPSGSYGVLMGQTGTGKTSVLEAICGLRPVASGRILLNGVDVTTTRPAERHVGYVPQDGALFRRMSVRKHLAFALTIRKWEKRRIHARVEEIAELLGIADLLERKPFGLSGGERQRVALGRALSFKPDILLLDEPLSALDEDTREQMCDLMKYVQQHEGTTVLHVTHSTSEATQLADCLLRIVNGRVMRMDSPFELKQKAESMRPLFHVRNVKAHKMKVTINYTGQLKAAIGAGLEDLEVDIACPLSRLIQEIASQHGDTVKQILLDTDGAVHQALMRVVNDVQSRPGEEVTLQDGDTITLIPPISGG